MRVGVIGAGIVGVTTAYELAVAGHEATVFERRGSVAAEASFANAGVVAPGYVGPWAAPGTAARMLRQFASGEAPVRWHAFGGLRHLPWAWRWWRACRPATYRANRRAMHRLAQYSRERLLQLTRDLGLDYEQTPGFIVLLRSERDLERAGATLELMREMGVAHELVDGARCRALEPALNPHTPLHAAIHLAQDGVGNCRHFAQLLKGHAQRLGAVFRFDSEVRGLHAGAQPVLETAHGARQQFDAVVVCAGVQANALLRRIGIELPLAPVYGYTLTAPLRHLEGQAQIGPRAALIDERYKVAITRLGQRVRVAGIAEIGGRADDLALAPLRKLYRVLDDWFPGAALIGQAQHWKGARPMLPDGPPVLGASGAPGVWLNLGHGSSGWALACGSARVLAECIGGRAPPLDLEHLTPARWR